MRPSRPSLRAYRVQRICPASFASESWSLAAHLASETETLSPVSPPRRGKTPSGGTRENLRAARFLRAGIIERDLPDDVVPVVDPAPRGARSAAPGVGADAAAAHARRARGGRHRRLGPACPPRLLGRRARTLRPRRDAPRGARLRRAAAPRCRRPGEDRRPRGLADAPVVYRDAGRSRRARPVPPRRG